MGTSVANEQVFGIDGHVVNSRWANFKSLSVNNISLSTVFWGRSTQGHIQGVCLAVLTGPFVPQVLSIKADKRSSIATAGL